MPETATQTRKLPLRIWDRLEIIVGEGNTEGVYTSRLEDIESGKLVIGRPVFRHGKSLLAAGRPVTVSYTRADAAYQFTAMLVEAEPRSRETVWLVNLGNVRRSQRRRFVRVELGVKVAYSILERPVTEESINKTPEKHTATTTNISAGGILLSVIDELQADTYLLLHITSRNSLRFPDQMLGVCRRVSEPSKEERNAGIEFILAEDISQHFKKEEMKLLPGQVKLFTSWAQNELVSSLFSEEISLRQKGLI